MKLSQLKQVLAQHFQRNIRFVLPTGSKIPPHAHVTEVARLDKRFIDCGGTLRNELSCRLQTWFADDTDHRLTAGKLLTILQKSERVLETDELEVEVECEAPFIAHFPISAIEPESDSLVIRLGVKHTACLAEDQCMKPTPGSMLFKPLATLKI